jgi:multidrug efflux pump subunit AcrA (membrane-fusion protein)
MAVAGCGRGLTPGAQAAGPDRAGRPAITVQPRDFVRRVRLTGLTEATRSYIVTTPLLTGETRGQLVVTRLAPAGAAVKPGDVLVQFDSQAQDRAAVDKRAEYETLVQEIRQKEAEQQAARVKDEAEVEKARNAVRNYELEVLKNEMLSRILAEKNDQDLAEARAKLAALEEGLELKRVAAEAELRILQIRRDRAKAAMEHAVANSRSMSVRAPIEGLVVPKMMWRGNGPAEIQEGDELWPGAAVLQVVNPDSMQVRARVNQADLGEIRPGQRATIRLDAYPDLSLPGRILQIAPIGQPGAFSNRVRFFTAVVAVEGRSERLLPDLSAAVDVEVAHAPGALVVPWTAVERDESGARVRVRDGGGTTLRPVTLGPADEIEVVVASGLQPGDEVVP